MTGTRKIFAICACILVAAVVTSCGPSGKRAESTGPPPPPEDLHVRMVPEGLNLMWSPVPGAERYTLFWGKEREQYAGLLDVSCCSMKVGGFEQGQLYSFAVTAWNEHGESQLSEEEVFIYDDDPKRATYYISQGHDLLKKGRFRDAHTYFETAIRLDPHSAYAYQGRAVLYEKVNRPRLAKQDYAKAQELLKKRPLSKKNPDPLKEDVAPE